MNQRSEQVALFAALNASGVDYAVVGGVAVNAHGFVRNTRDLDVFIRPTEANAQAAFRALEALGAPLAGMDYSDLLLEDAHFQFHAEHGLIELLTFIGDMSFYQVWQNHIDIEIDGVLVHFISKADLIENKLQVGRFIDLADAEELSRVPDRDLQR